jgi:hypothetical protein
MRRINSESGVTLLEIAIGLMVLFVGGTVLVAGVRSTVSHIGHLGEKQIAIYAAQGQLEQLSATAMDTLWTGAAFAGARGNGQFAPIADLPAAVNGGLGIQIRSADTIDPPDLIDIHVAACWNSQGHQIGEDQNCNGQLDAGEDTNGDGWISSAVMVSTRKAREL